MRLARSVAGSRGGCTRALPSCVQRLASGPRRWSPELQPCHVPHSSSKTALRSNQEGTEPQVEAAAIAKAAEPEADEQLSPYLDSMLRSFALGIGVGVLVELGHVLFQCAAAGPSLPELIPDFSAMEELLSPLRMWDNLAAMTGTFVFYIVEVGAIMAVLRQYPNDNKSAYKALQSNVTLSKRLLPFSLTNARRALYLFMTNRSPQPSPASALPDMQDGLPSGFGPAASGTPPTMLSSAVGTAVLERPPATAPAPAPAPAPAQAPRGRSTAPGQLLDKVPTWPQRPPSPDPAPGATRRAKPPPGSRPQLKKLPGVRPPRPPASNSPPPAKPRAPGSARGSLDPGTASFLAASAARAKFISERRAYLKNFWYAAAQSATLLPGKPLEVQILGRTVVLFRDAATGRPMCLDNVCPHRGAPLAKGWLQEIPAAKAGADAGACSSKAPGAPPPSSTTCITCPYHGWAFDSAGVLKNVPSQDSQSALPRRSLLDAYPVEERGGFVWLFFGSSKLPAEERPPIPSCPELEDPAWTKVYGEIEFEAPHFEVFDNTIDMTHVHYIHDDSFGNKEKPMIRNMEVSMGAYGMTANFRIHNKPSNAMWEWTAIESVPIQATAHLPSTSVIKNFLGAGVSMVVFMNTVPISAQRSVIRFCHIRNFAGWDGLDAWARAAMIKILKEDKQVVEKLRPDSVRHEVSLQADMPQVAFRRVRQSWVDAGYAVDPEATPRHGGSLDM